MAADPNTSAPTDDVRPWPKLSSRPGPDLKLFQVRFDRLTNPRTEETLERLVLDTPDWVNVVALTPDRRLVCVRQYRFGTETITLEIPGGMVDRGEGHREAAERELLEETGYRAQRWSYLGCVEANPAIHNNRLHHWLALDAASTGHQELDEGEDIQVVELDLEEARRAVFDGRIAHSLVVCALARVLDLRVEPPPDPPDIPPIR